MLEIGLCIIYFILFTFLILKLKVFSVEGLTKRFIIAIFALKVLAGVGLTLIYTYHYTDRHTADVFKYYDDSKHMYDALSESPGDYVKMLTGIGNDTPHFDRYYSKMLNWKRQFENQVYNDHQTMIRLNAFLRLFSFGSYHVHTLFMCFLSLLGLVCIYKALQRYFDGKRRLLALLIFLVPSVLFWGSPVLKEGIVLLGLGLLLYSVMRLSSAFSIKYLIILVLAITCLLYVKIYVLLAIIPAVLAYMLAVRMTKVRPIIIHAAVLILGTTAILSMKHVSPQYDVLRTIVTKQVDFVGLTEGGVVLEDGPFWMYFSDDQRDQLVKVDTMTYTIVPGSDYPRWHCIDKDTTWVTNSTDTAAYHARFDLPASGSRFELTPLEPSLWSFIRLSPEAIHNALFRPWFFQAGSMFEWAAAIESLFTLIFIMICLVLMRKVHGAEANLLLMLFTYSVIMLLLIGWVTPVAGAIVRYRVPVYPLLLPAFLLILNTSKLPEKWRKLL